MMTCRLMECPFRSTCHLEENGAIDLCPVLRRIKAEAREQVERIWNERYPPHEVVPLEHFQGTRTTITVGFTATTGLDKIAALVITRREATLKQQEFMDKHKLAPVEPRPEPKKILRRRKDLDFHEMPTDTIDYCAYRPIEHVEDMEAKEMKAKADVTKKQRAYWREVNARQKIQKNQDERELFLMQLLDDMDIDK